MAQSYSADYICVITRILMAKFKFAKVEICMVLTYGLSGG